MGAKSYTKLNIIATYDIQCIQAENEQKTVYKYCYGHFEY